MRRLLAVTMCVVNLGVMSNSLSAQETLPCSGIELMQSDLIVTCDDEVLLQSSTGPLLWNQDQFSDSLLVSSSGLVEVQEAAFDLSIVDLGEEFGYLNLGDGFNNLTFPLTIVARFSIPEGYDGFHLFATDEGLGYSGVSLSLNQSQGWFSTSIGDGYGGSPGQRRSKASYCSLSTDTWYTVVAVIRGATDHTVYLDGVELGGDYSGSGNGQIVDLGRPATMGYHVPDSGPLVGQESSSTMKFDFLGVYDFELQSSDIINSGSCDSDSSSALVRPSGAVGWYDFDEDEPFADSEGNQPPIQAVGDVQSDVTYCLCPGIEQVEVQLLDCEYAEFLCGEGTTWDNASQTCIVANPADINLDGCVQLGDLLDLLSAYGNCAAEESVWQCGDPLEYQGYDYQTVQIGEQCWFAENVRYLPGVSPPSIGSEQDGLPHAYVYGWYSEDGDVDAAMSTPNYNSFGALYNFQAVTTWDLCPSGWHVPSAAEFRALDVALGLPDEELNNIGWTGGGAEIGTALKVESGWCCGGGGTNTSGFSAKGAGGRWGDGPAPFADVGLASRWWTSTGSGENAWHHDVASQNPGVYWKDDAPKSRGHSVRCVKDTDL